MSITGLIVGTILKKLQEESAQEESGRQAKKTQSATNISQARTGREEARNTMFDRGNTGLAGMDVMNPATSRQMQIFNNVVNRYSPQQQPAGGMVQ